MGSSAFKEVDLLLFLSGSDFTCGLGGGEEVFEKVDRESRLGINGEDGFEYRPKFTRIGEREIVGEDFGLFCSNNSIVDRTRDF